MKHNTNRLMGARKLIQGITSLNAKIAIIEKPVN